MALCPAQTVSTERDFFCASALSSTPFKELPIEDAWWHTPDAAEGRQRNALLAGGAAGMRAAAAPTESLLLIILQIPIDVAIVHTLHTSMSV